MPLLKPSQNKAVVQVSAGGRFVTHYMMGSIDQKLTGIGHSINELPAGFREL